jgi:hypothetical protein
VRNYGGGWASTAAAAPLPNNLQKHYSQVVTNSHSAAFKCGTGLWRTPSLLYKL